jgi:hypothetical protein
LYACTTTIEQQEDLAMVVSSRDRELNAAGGVLGAVVRRLRGNARSATRSYLHAHWDPVKRDWRYHTHEDSTPSGYERQER